LLKITGIIYIPSCKYYANPNITLTPFRMIPEVNDEKILLQRIALGDSEAFYVILKQGPLFLYTYTAVQYPCRRGPSRSDVKIMAVGL
jgi:hypothetical protein